jgi:DNA-binding response OmpR family regulator
LSASENIGRLLLARGLLDEAGLQRVLSGVEDKPAAFLTLVVASGAVEEHDLLEAVAEHLGIPGVDLSRSTLPLDGVDLIPRTVAEADLILPLSTEGGRLHVAVNAAAYSQAMLDELQFITGLLVSPYAALPEALERSIGPAYDARARGEKEWRGAAVAKGGPDVMVVVLPEPILEPEPLEGAALEAVLSDEAGDLSVEVGGADDGSEEVVHSEKVKVGPPRVFVVDDEPEIVRMLEKSLKNAGFAVDTAADGREAEKKLQAGPPPDLVLLDAMLPHVHGFEICSRIKGSGRTRGVPVIMMSAVYRGWRFAQDARETFGADDYIEKPFHLAEVIRKVQERISAPPKPTVEEREAAEQSYHEGLQLLEEGKAPQARAALERTVKSDPFSARGHFALARALRDVGEAFRAMSAYERAVELRPHHFAALSNLSDLYLEKGFRRKAIETLERAIAAAPDGRTRETIRGRLLRLL